MLSYEGILPKIAVHWLKSLPVDMVVDAEVQLLVIILIMITNLQPPNQQAPKQRFEGVLNARGLVQWHGSGRAAA